MKMQILNCAFAGHKAKYRIAGGLTSLNGM